MFFWKLPKQQRKLKREAIPSLFLVLGFFGAAITTEVMNIIHEFAKNVGWPFFVIYGCFIIFVAWPWILIQIVNAIEVVYKKN